MTLSMGRFRSFLGAGAMFPAAIALAAQLSPVRSARAEPPPLPIAVSAVEVADAMLAETYDIPFDLIARDDGDVEAFAQATGDPQAAPKPQEAPQRPDALQDRPIVDSRPVELPAISGELRGDVVSTPIDDGKLLIVGNEEDVEFLVRLLSAMDAQSPEATYEIIPLEHANAGAIQPIVEQAFRSYLEVQGRTDRLSRFSIVAEGRSNSLIVASSAANLEIIRNIISKIDNPDARGEGTPAIIQLQHVKASKAAEILQAALQQLSAKEAVPDAVRAAVQAIETTNSLLVIGTQAEQARIRELINAIDVEVKEGDVASFNQVDILIVDLKNADAESLATTLNALIRADQAAAGAGGAAGGRTAGSLVRRLNLRTADGQPLPPIDLDRPISILAEKSKNSLIILSSAKNNSALQQIVGLFDTLPEGLEIEVKSFALHHASAQTVAEMMQRMFDDSKKTVSRPSAGGQATPSGTMPPVPPNLSGKGLPYSVVVTHDPRTNSVLVVGRKESVLLAAGVLTELDKPSVDLSMRPYVLQLKNKSAKELQEKLDDLLEKRLQAIGGDSNAARDSAILSPDERTNSLVIVATPDIYRMVESLATELDNADSYRVVDTRYYRLQYADSAKLQTMLQDLFDKKSEAAEKAETQTKDSLSVLADPRSNSLFVVATRDYLREAEQYIKDLDQAFDSTVSFKVRPVTSGSATNIASLLNDMIEKSRSGSTSGGGAGGGGSSSAAGGGSPIHIAADPYSANLLLAASKEDMIMLDRWIDLLDKPAEIGRVTKIIPVTRGRAEDLARSAETIFRTSGGARGATGGTTGGATGGASGMDLTVTFEPVTNSVVAVGPPQVVKDIEDLLVKIEKNEAIGGTIVRIFKLEQADARTSGDLLRNILERRGGSVGSGTGTTGGVSSTTGTTSTTGTSSTGGASANNAKAAQVMFLIKQKNADAGQEMARALASEINVISDTRTNSLIITAPIDSMTFVETLVAAVDVPPRTAMLRVFRLRNSDAEATVSMLENIISSRGSGTGTAGTTRSTTTGGTTGNQSSVLSLGESVTGLEEVKFSTDVRTNSIVAAGTPGYLDLVEKLILDLDSNEIPGRVTKIYWPKNTSVEAMQQAIADFADRDRQLLDEMGSEVSPQRKLERNIVAVASAENNRLLIGYDPRRELDINNMLRELDQPPPQVSIQVMIIEVTMRNTLELGVEFAFQDLQFTKAGPTDTTTFDFVGGTDIGAAGSGLGGFTFTITGADLNFLLRTLQSESKLNVLSRPHIMAQDNKEATIEITNDVPYVTGTSTSIAGQVTTSVNRQPVGIILNVTPHINPDGFVRLEVDQEVSDFTESSITIAPGVQAPVFFKRKATTEVTVKDNETVVLGGLITSRENVTEQKVPILGDLPGVGLAFRNDVRDTQRSELLLVLTPRVVRTVEDFRDLSVQERNRAGGLPDEFLTHPLMEKLRVPEEELPPRKGLERLGPFPGEKRDSSDEIPEIEFDPAIYGPGPSPAAPLKPTEPSPKPAPDSYDIPVARKSR